MSHALCVRLDVHGPEQHAAAAEQCHFMNAAEIVSWSRCGVDGTLA